MVEHIMTMAHTATEHDFTCGLAGLRNILKKYKKVGPHARISRLKSYIKIIKNEDGTDAVIIQGPWRNETGSWHYIYLYPGTHLPIRLMRTWDPAVRNTQDTRLFFDIYEIPNDLYYELETLTVQWQKQSTTN